MLTGFLRIRFVGMENFPKVCFALSSRRLLIPSAADLVSILLVHVCATAHLQIGVEACVGGLNKVRRT